MNTFSLVGGRIVDPGSGRDEFGDLHVIDGMVSEHATGSGASIDVTGKWVIPGLVDLHGRLAASGRSIGNRSDELVLAARCGVTAMCIGPDTDSVLDSAAALDQLTQLVNRADGCQVHPLGALTLGLAGEQLAELATLSACGCVAFSDLHLTTRDARVLLRAMHYAKNFDLTILVQPNDPWLSAEGCVHDGPLAHRMGLPGVPVSAETVAISLWLELCRETGTRLHFNKLSSARGTELVRKAKSEGLPVTADTSINHTRFDADAVAGFENRFKLWPPLRTRDDRIALCEGLRDGTLDAICSDHCNHAADDTLAPIQSAAAGGATIQALLPATLTLGETLGMSALRALEWLTVNPALALNLDAGRIEEGDVANLCVFDPTQTWTFGREGDATHSAHSPWSGQSLHGRVSGVAVAGQYREVEPGTGGA